MVKEVFLLCFIIHSRFFVPSCLSCKQFLKNTCQPYKIWYRKAYATATGFRSLQKKVMTHLLKGIFLHHEKDQTKNFSPFSYERPFDHWKEFLKSSQFHFKGFHFKSTSSGSFNKVWWKSRNHTEIRNPSETYLEPSQRSMTKLFCINN